MYNFSVVAVASRTAWSRQRTPITTVLLAKNISALIRSKCRSRSIFLILLCRNTLMRIEYCLGSVNCAYGRHRWRANEPRRLSDRNPPLDFTDGYTAEQKHCSENSTKATDYTACLTCKFACLVWYQLNYL